MQKKIKNENGVTLAILVITIIVLSIILGITLNYGLDEIHDVSNKKVESELSIVQEAVMQRYSLVKSKNLLGKKASSITADTKLADDSRRPTDFVGTRLAKTEDILNSGFQDVELAIDYNSGDSDLTYEQYYYILDEDDLKELGIEKGDDTDITGTGNTKSRKYIVNYLYGEIFDLANKKYYKTSTTNDTPVYIQPTDVNTSVEDSEYDFSDDN